MNAPNPNPQIRSGAAMDRVVKIAPHKRRLKVIVGACIAMALCALVWFLLPRGIPVKADEVQIATVGSGMFHDALVQRGSLVPLSSVFLDATDGGRVEEVRVRNGALLKKGELLFRLSNPQREQDVLARSAEVAQQLANLSSLRAALASAQSAYRRDESTAQYNVEQAKIKYERDVRLAEQGFIAQATLKEAADNLGYQRNQLERIRVDGQAELTTRNQSLREMNAAIDGLQNGLGLVRASVDGLSVRAPVDGRLTNFQLEVGELIKPSQRLGRIDDPGQFKLAANVDEYYLARVTPRLRGSVVLDGKTHAITLSRVDPQVKDGRFTVELTFDEGVPVGIQPGQSADITITLGQSKQALLIPDGLFYADSGGSWVFIVDADGKQAKRQTVRLGRRAAGKIEVLDGLKAGDRLIVSSYRQFGTAETLRLVDK